MHRQSSKKVVVLLISDLEFGGAQRQVVELANRMPASRYEIHVCVLADYVPLADGLRDRNARLHIVRKAHKFDFRIVPKLVSLLRELGADLLHTYLFDAEFFGRIAGRIAGVKVVGSERNTSYQPRLRHKLAFAATKALPSVIVANSNAGADFNSRMFGIDRSRYRVVHNGVDTEKFRPLPVEDLKQEFGIAHGDRVVGMFGSFKEQKNHQYLLRAAALLVKTIPNLRFLFVGDELYMGMSGSVHYKKEVLELVKSLGIERHCIFAGNRSDVERWYSLCDITVLPSLFEGTPNVALESMACGVPVVATDVSDNSLVIPDGEVGRIVPLGEPATLAGAIRSLIDDDALRSRMSVRAREWVLAEFSGPRLAEKTADVYDDVLADH